jgi:VIT1/CCC1 family predicted Fe2+/Mn2+ transporter
MSMAAGEYVSVSSQADAERADLKKEREELATNFGSETRELAAIYQQRGLDAELAQKVAVELMAKDPLAAHARDELGITSSSIGAMLPLLLVLAVPVDYLIFTVSAASLLLLVTLGAVAARTGGASVWRGALRVGFWGAAAMALTAGIGKLVGAAL